MDVLPVLQLAVLLVILAAITVIDWRRMIIPDALNLLLAASGLAFSLAAGMQPLWLPFAGAAVVFGMLWLGLLAYEHASGRVALGMGDVKMLAAAMFWIDPLSLPILMLAASLSALVFAGGRAVAVGGVTMTSRVPFGPFLALGLLTVWCLEQFWSLGFWR